MVGKGLAGTRAAFVRTVFASTAPFSDDPGRLLSWANTALAERAEEDDRDFVTVGCDRLAKGPHPALGLRRAPAGALAGHRRGAKGRARAPLGLSEEFACPTAAHQLAPGTGVLLYTDGVTEARHDGEQFGQTRGSKRPDARRAVPSEVVTAVTTQVQEFAASGLADDLCVVAARIGED